MVLRRKARLRKISRSIETELDNIIRKTPEGDSYSRAGITSNVSALKKTLKAAGEWAEAGDERTTSARQAVESSYKWIKGISRHDKDPRIQNSLKLVERYLEEANRYVVQSAFQGFAITEKSFYNAKTPEEAEVALKKMEEKGAYLKDNFKEKHGYANIDLKIKKAKLEFKNKYSSGE